MAFAVLIWTHKEEHRCAVSDPFLIYLLGGPKMCSRLGNALVKYSNERVFGGWFSWVRDINYVQTTFRTKSTLASLHFRAPPSSGPTV